MVERKRPDGAIDESSVKALISLIISLPSPVKPGANSLDATIMTISMGNVNLAVKLSHCIPITG